jgi:transposase
MQYVAPLPDVEIQTLHEMHRYHPSRRARMRAQSLLLSHQGVSMPPMARIDQVDYRSVSSWIDQWQTRGFVGLYDQPGAGRRPTLSFDEQQKVQQYLQDSPKDFKQVVHQLEQETRKHVSTKTMKRLMKKNRDVWKRIRKGPAKSPDPHQDERSQGFMNQLQQREAVGEGDLWYCDGTGFCFTPGIPYAWQPIGHTIEIPASRHSQRVHV